MVDEISENDYIVWLDYEADEYGYNIVVVL